MSTRETLKKVGLMYVIYTFFSYVCGSLILIARNIESSELGLIVFLRRFFILGGFAVIIAQTFLIFSGTKVYSDPDLMDGVSIVYTKDAVANNIPVVDYRMLFDAKKDWENDAKDKSPEAIKMDPLVVDSLITHNALKYKNMSISDRAKASYEATEKYLKYRSSLREAKKKEISAAAAQ